MAIRQPQRFLFRKTPDNFPSRKNRRRRFFIKLPCACIDPDVYLYFVFSAADGKIKLISSSFETDTVVALHLTFPGANLCLWFKYKTFARKFLVWRVIKFILYFHLFFL